MTHRISTRKRPQRNFANSIVITDDDPMPSVILQLVKSRSNVRFMKEVLSQFCDKMGIPDMAPVFHQALKLRLLELEGKQGVLKLPTGKRRARIDEQLKRLKERIRQAQEQGLLSGQEDAAADLFDL